MTKKELNYYLQTKNISLAKPYKRILARLVDFFLFFFIFLFFYFLFLDKKIIEIKISMYLKVFIFDFFIIFLYFFLFFVFPFFKKQTIGKLFFKICILNCTNNQTNSFNNFLWITIQKEFLNFGSIFLFATLAITFYWEKYFLASFFVSLTGMFFLLIIFLLFLYVFSALKLFGKNEDEAVVSIYDLKLNYFVVEKYNSPIIKENIKTIKYNSEGLPVAELFDSSDKLKEIDKLINEND